jgi:hypothetical protein
MLPITLRQRWWQDVVSDRKPPTKELIDEVNRAVQAQRR